MASQTSQLHFVLFPFLAPGHMIPMVDIARVLAQRGVTITVVTTPLNAARFKSTFARSMDSGLPIQVVQLQFPCSEVGLPEGYENLDMLPSSIDTTTRFLTATSMLEEPVENILRELNPPPSCIISDMCFPYTLEIANKLNIPRLTFHGMGCFAVMCLLSMHMNAKEIESSVTSESDHFVLPGLPDEVKFTIAQRIQVQDQQMWDKIMASDLGSFGVIVNSFEELEPAYVGECKKVRQGRTWCIGPVSLYNKDNLDKAQRGNNTASNIDQHECLRWLDSKKPGSVVYACFGTLCHFITSQLVELGLGLEATKKPFLWVLRGTEKSKELEEWILVSGYEERIKGRGMLIRGWAPQLLILSHPAIGAFLTHCGWNSTLEGITAGVPLITWPLFSDQFSNEKLVVQLLKIGVSVGVECPLKWSEEEKFGLVAKREDVEKAINEVMDEEEEAKARRERARELGKLAKEAVEEGGSSHRNITKLIDDIMQVAMKEESLHN